MYNQPQRRSLAMSLGAGGGNRLPSFKINFIGTPAKGSDYGRIGITGQRRMRPKEAATRWGVTIRNTQPKLELVMSAFCPGAVVKTEATGLDMFIQSAASKTTPPEFLAYPAGGTIRVRKASGAVSLNGLSRPWVLAFWASRRQPAIPAPILIILEKRVEQIKVANDRWSVMFGAPAGTTVLMPLYGQTLPKGTDTAKWVRRLPKEVATFADRWAQRMRHVPIDVKETYEINGNVVKITESFKYYRIHDTFNTPSKPWAFIPPIFGLAKAMGGPVQIDEGTEDSSWQAAFGPLYVLDGQHKVSFSIRIPQLKKYLWEMSTWKPGNMSDPQYVLLRNQVRAEVDKILAVNRHLAPYEEHYTKEGWINQIWGNPGEAILSMVWALPYLDGKRASGLKEYIKREYKSYHPLKISWSRNEGIRREFFNDVNAKRLNPGSDRTRPNIHNLYAVWAYVDKVAGKIAAAGEFRQVRTFLAGERQKAGYLWDAGEAPCLNLNPRLNGYLGYARLARLAGDLDAEREATALFARGLVIKYVLANYHQYSIEKGWQPGLPSQFPTSFFSGDPNYQGLYPANLENGGLDFCRNVKWANARWPYLFFADLTPEVGQFMNDYVRTSCAAIIRKTQWQFPGYWLNKGGFVYLRHETILVQPWVPWAGFLSQTFAMKQSPKEFWPYIGQPLARCGDWYYMQKLTAALRSFSEAKDGR